MNTNWIYMGFLLTKSDRRGMGVRQRKDVIELIGADPESVIPYDMTNVKYSKKIHEDYLFLFLDEKFELIGSLYGNKRHEKMKSYNAIKYDSYGSEQVTQNRKNLTQAATYIIAFSPEQRCQIKEIRKSKPSQQYFPTGRKAKDRLKTRLDQYKSNKYNDVTVEKVQKIVKDFTRICSEVMFTEKEKAVITGFGYYHDNMSRVVRNILDYYYEFERGHEEYEKHMKYIKDEYGEEGKDNSSFYNTWVKRDLDRRNVAASEIINSYNKLKELIK